MDEAKIGVLAAVGLSIAGFVTLTIAQWNNPRWGDMLLAGIGVPFAIAIASVVVLGFRSISGPIEFSTFGMNYKGAAGPIIMWVLCFLAVVGAIKILML